MARLDPDKLPFHVAIIPDGNGRWAECRGLARLEGHRRGTENVRTVMRAAHELGIRALTFYAFSIENWRRPEAEVDGLMDLLADYLAREAEELMRNGIRLQAIGRLRDLPPRLVRELEAVVARTEGNEEMLVTFALSYSGRTEVVDAARRLAREVESGRVEADAIDEKCFESYLYAPGMPDPDLLIRTGGESRISNCLMWQLAYSELYFSGKMWPDFAKADLVEALVAFQARERRFGRTGEQIRVRR
ncbi:MAG: polyprenyl diphosphate synthase [Myxococcota bacterium]